MCLSRNVDILSNENRRVKLDAALMSLGCSLDVRATMMKN